MLTGVGHNVRCAFEKGTSQVHKCLRRALPSSAVEQLHPPRNKVSKSCYSYVVNTLSDCVVFFGLIVQYRFGENGKI